MAVSGRQLPSEDLCAVVQRTILSGERPARSVIRDDENDWCVGDDVNDPNVARASVIAHMTHVLARDSSVGELALTAGPDPFIWRISRTAMTPIALD